MLRIPFRVRETENGELLGGIIRTAMARAGCRLTAQTKDLNPRSVHRGVQMGERVVMRTAAAANGKGGKRGGKARKATGRGEILLILRKGDWTPYLQKNAGGIEGV